MMEAALLALVLFCAHATKPSASEHAPQWLAGAAIVLAASSLDASTQRHWRSGRTIASIGNLWGLGAPWLLAADAWRKDEPAFPYVQAGVAAALAAGTLKVVTGRARPDAGEGARSFHPFTLRDRWHAFPSGHTMLAAAAAGVEWQRTDIPDWRKALVGALALSTAYARVQQRRHWLSDVTAGLLLGGVVGVFSARHSLLDRHLAFDGQSLWLFSRF